MSNSKLIIIFNVALVVAIYWLHRQSEVLVNDQKELNGILRTLNVQSARGLQHSFHEASKMSQVSPEASIEFKLLQRRQPIDTIHSNSESEIQYFNRITNIAKIYNHFSYKVDRYRSGYSESETETIAFLVKNKNKTYLQVQFFKRFDAMNNTCLSINDTLQDCLHTNNVDDNDCITYVEKYNEDRLFKMLPDTLNFYNFE